MAVSEPCSTKLSSSEHNHNRITIPHEGGKTVWILIAAGQLDTSGLDKSTRMQASAVKCELHEGVKIVLSIK
jgi:hypothetical protein